MNPGPDGSPGKSVADIDLYTYLNYIVTKQPLKAPPAFDKMGVLGPDVTPENHLFGDATGKPANYTDFALRKITRKPGACRPSPVFTRRARRCQ